MYSVVEEGVGDRETEIVCNKRERKRESERKREVHVVRRHRRKTALVMRTRSEAE